MLLPELAGPEVADAAATIRTAVRSIDLAEADAIVLLTPHGDGTGVYREIAGDLTGFGVRGIDAEAETDESLVQEIARPRLDSRIDHGVLVPLLLAGWEVPVVAIALDRPASLQLHNARKRVAVVASINGSAGMSPRAPLTEIPGAAAAQDRFVGALEADLSEAARVDLPGSCAASVLATFADLWSGARARVLAHEAPVGVGYVVASVQ